MPQFKVIPCDNWLLIDPDILRQKGKIVLPDAQRGRSGDGVIDGMRYNRLATVLAVGPGKIDPDTGKRNPPPDFAVGDRVVLYKLYQDNFVEIGSAKYCLIDPDQVFAKTTLEPDDGDAAPTEPPAATG